jgi:hypothetical protein
MVEECCNDNSKKEYCFDSLKEDYKEFKEKYNLPEITLLAEDFDIEKMTERKPLFLLKDIRKIINERISSYLVLFEHFKNPSSSPMFIFSLLKNSNGSEKDIIEEVYKKIAKIELSSLKLDAIYNEEREADFIKKGFEEWQDLKKKIYNLLEKLENGFENSETSSKKSYYG